MELKDIKLSDIPYKFCYSYVGQKDFSHYHIENLEELFKAYDEGLFATYGDKNFSIETRDKMMEILGTNDVVVHDAGNQMIKGRIEILRSIYLGESLPTMDLLNKEVELNDESKIKYFFQRGFTVKFGQIISRLGMSGAEELFLAKYAWSHRDIVNHMKLVDFIRMVSNDEEYFEYYVAEMKKNFCDPEYALHAYCNIKIASMTFDRCLGISEENKRKL